MAQLFRKSSIEKLSSPEQLDKTIVVTSPMSWLALVGIAVIVGCFMVWAVFGTMPSTIEAKGVISGGVYTNSVYSPFNGTLTQVFVSQGEAVQKGSVLCTVEDENGSLNNICAEETCIITECFAESGAYVNCASELFGISPAATGDGFVVFYVGIEQLAGIDAGMDVIVNLPAYDNQKYGHMTGKVVLIDRFASSDEAVNRIAGNNEDLKKYLGTMEQPVAAVTCTIEKDAESANGYKWSSGNGESLSAGIGSVVDVKVVLSESAPITKLVPGLDV